MKILYSKLEHGFFTGDMSNVPEDCIEISSELHQKLVVGQEGGGIIVSGADGLPMLAVKKPTDYHEWDGNAWYITEENIVRQEAEDQERLAAENMAFAQVELSRVMDEIKLLTKKVDYGRASEADKDRLIKLDFYSFDLDEFIQGVRHELPVIPD